MIIQIREHPQYDKLAGRLGLYLHILHILESLCQSRFLLKGTYLQYV